MNFVSVLWGQYSQPVCQADHPYQILFETLKNSKIRWKEGEKKVKSRWKEGEKKVKRRWKVGEKKVKSRGKEGEK